MESNEEVPHVDVEALAALVAGGATLIDVREADEYAEVRAAGTRLVPLGEVPERIGEFPRDGAVYVICRSGARSLRACEFLRANGVDATNVAGGTLAWMEAGLPTEHGQP